MNILLVGNRGRIGSYFQNAFKAENIHFTGYDQKDGKDLLDITKLEENLNKADVVVDLATCAHDDFSEIMNVNLQGLWNLLHLSKKQHIKKVIFMSSVDAIGVFKGESAPKYLPINNEHPCYPSSAYGISKYLSEKMCEYWSISSKIPTICLRPPGVWFEETYFEILEARKKDPKYEWDPYWEYGAFIDIRDLYELTKKVIITSSPEYFKSYLVSSDDITTSGLSSRELVNKIHPNELWVGDADYEKKPYKTLLDIEQVKAKYSWKPEYSWERFITDNEGQPRPPGVRLA
jgi:UDP-glucose 4-epimerase